MVFCYFYFSRLRLEVRGTTMKEIKDVVHSALVEVEGFEDQGIDGMVVEAVH